METARDPDYLATGNDDVPRLINVVVGALLHRIGTTGEPLVDAVVDALAATVRARFAG